MGRYIVYKFFIYSDVNGSVPSTKFYGFRHAGEERSTYPDSCCKYDNLEDLATKLSSDFPVSNLPVGGEIILDSESKSVQFRYPLHESEMLELVKHLVTRL